MCINKFSFEEFIKSESANIYNFFKISSPATDWTRVELCDETRLLALEKFEQHKSDYRSLLLRCQVDMARMYGLALNWYRRKATVAIKPNGRPDDLYMHDKVPLSVWLIRSTNRRIMLTLVHALGFTLEEVAVALRKSWSCDSGERYLRRAKEECGSILTALEPLPEEFPEFLYSCLTDTGTCRLATSPDAEFQLLGSSLHYLLARIGTLQDV